MTKLSEIQDSDKKLLWDTAVKLECLIERIDKHSIKNENIVESIHRKIDQITSYQDEIRSAQEQDRILFLEKTNKLEKDFIKENNKINMKIAFIIGSLGVAAGGVGSFGFKMLEKFF